MTLEIQGVPIRLIADDQVAGIHIRRSKQGILQLIAHPNTPQKELLAFADQHIADYINHNRTLEPNLEARFFMFDGDYRLVSDPTAWPPYLRGRAIYTARLPKNQRQADELKKKVLYGYLSLALGIWEDRIGRLTGEISIRKMPKSHYKATPDNGRIVFSSTLSDRSLAIVDYIIALAVFDYFGLKTTQRERLLQAHLPDWKHAHRTLAHEAQQ